ncbi:serine/threonine-protein kinase [Actinomadura parmotrematis]|uniref:Serine/threonine protein kinase n=1 Tax=Actinomadura parmotrematis TaxID=2864039 RepID=A0ABS7FLQ5_9ACTN|nr:serine/threonine-protein kinase [Actinomadura parmotrematis]MBW8481308.1 serine/threonine protein kinase [Actinomadura parmotrematis]
MSGWRVAGFEEVRELGAGAQGRVVLARHATAGTLVAIKYLDTAAAPPGALDRLRAEAAMLGRVSDPHVVRLYRLVTGERGAAIVMEAVDGVALKDVLAAHGALAPEAALSVLKGSLLGLAAAHAAGVVHRDYKPANVVVRADGLSKLIDFGIAALGGDDARTGTPVYMAPEQWTGRPASPATDVYAATCVFFECVTGERPFAAGDQAGLMRMHLHEPPPADRLPPLLRPLLERGMAKDPWGRPESAALFVQELEEAATAAYGPSWEQRGVRLVAGATAGLAALFPLLAAGLAPGGAAAGGVAAGGAVAGGGGAAAGGGLLAATGAKVAVGAAVAAVVAGGAGAGLVAVQQGGDAPRTLPLRPVSARVVSVTRPGSPPIREQYVTIGGHADPAVQTRVNAALRAGTDRQMARYRKSYAANTDVASVDATTDIGLHTARLLSVTSTYFPVVKNSVEGNWVKNFYTPGAVTVDLKNGAVLAGTGLLAPGSATEPRLRSLTALLASLDESRCLTQGGSGRPAVIRPRDLAGADPHVLISLLPRKVRFDINVFGLDAGVSEACKSTRVDVPVDRAAGYLPGWIAAEVRAGRPTPSPTPS